MNLLTVAGNLVADPEIRYTQSGMAHATFRIGVNRRYQSNGEWKQETQFLSCVCWSDLAESVNENLSKGQKVLVHGRLQQREYEGRDGQKKTSTEIAIEDVGVSLKSARKDAKQGAPKRSESFDEEPF